MNYLYECACGHRTPRYDIDPKNVPLSTTCEACGRSAPLYDISSASLSTQVGGDHYIKLKIQPVEFIHANNIPFIEGCIIKLAVRHRDKGKKQDIEKIKHFCDLLIHLEYDK